MAYIIAKTEGFARVQVCAELGLRSLRRSAAQVRYYESISVVPEPRVRELARAPGSPTNGEEVIELVSVARPQPSWLRVPKTSLRVSRIRFGRHLSDGLHAAHHLDAR